MNVIAFRALPCLLFVVCVTTSPLSVSAQTPLHERIDETYRQTTPGPIAPVADDAEFLKRIYLDLTGAIPSSAETQAFLVDPDPNKRVKLVDKLLGAETFSRHLATVFDVMLMERRGDKHVKSDAFRAFLQESFVQNKPYNVLAAELIAADIPGDKDQVQAAFLLERDVEPNLLTREVARMFFGMDYQCAQCHDHPIVDDYKQEDYFGLYAFLSRSSLFRPDAKKPALIAETAEGQSPFKSVFTEREAFTAPRLPGEAEIVEPAFAAGDEYTVKPAKNVRPVPRYSRRGKLAELLRTGQNDYFRRNIVNRLWALMMGRGLVHPVDMHHSGNPPSHPELLDLLASEFAAMNFEVQPFLRELVLTDVYQRADRFDEEGLVPVPQLKAAVSELNQKSAAATKAYSDLQAKASEALTMLDTAIAAANPVRDAWSKARTAAVASAKKTDAAITARNGKQAAFDQKSALTNHLTEALTNSKAAAELLSDAKELTSSITTLESKAKTFSAERDKLQQELSAAGTAAEAAISELAQSRETEEAERKKLQPLLDVIRTHRANLVAALVESQRVATTATSAQKSMAFLQDAISQSQAALKVSALLDQANALNARSVEVRTTVLTAEGARGKLDNAMTESLVRTREMVSASDALEKEMLLQRQVAELLADAVQSTTRAQAELNSNDMTSLLADVTQVTEQAASKLGQTQSQRDAAVAAMTEHNAEVESLRMKLQAAQTQEASARKQADTVVEQLRKTNQELTGVRSELDELETRIDSGATESFRTATLAPLTPEQLAWSVLQATGQADRQLEAELAKINKEKPLTAEQQADPQVVAARTAEAESAAYQKLTKTVDRFVSLFGGQKGQPQDDFFATVEQALFFANGGEMRSWLAPSGDNLTARLLKLQEQDALTEELYLSILVRHPTAEELADVEAYLNVRKDDRSAAIQEVAWALMTSVEFRFH